ncbi:nitrous oxide reductase accessory protein NosL [Pseudomonas schmalbachii]|uniref:Nitrous oxide reductase accessory protein NosL n=1 Tax=Pseudomonas schmalbachii TaxID=2816993 RepID=A0ABS3TL72_9PSED|nr:nitrous oxide reductase accessory protein NosL [Pseudomonas schmalbachii]MBO3274401.1 nitrous oxide reductase accessory protein NosL [Pseudomonas schmalbachii]
MCIRCSRRQWLAGAGVLVLAGLVGCDGNAPVGVQAGAAPAVLDADAECAVCGMRVRGFPGPKAQAIALVGQQRRSLFFCSTRDFFAFVQQPENRQAQAALYVQDMTGADWNRPETAPWIPAHDAFYVPSRKLTGAMGPTFAAFATREAAGKWAGEQGESEVLGFAEIDQGRVMGLGEGHHHH